MAHVTIRRDADNRSLAMPLREDTPLRIMRSMFGWDPVRGWDPFREVSPFLAESPLTASFSPTFEVKETKDAYLFRADVPGVHEKDLDVSLTGNRVTISGKREAEPGDKSDSYYAYERTFGSFSRSFTLPAAAAVEQVRAELSEGVLTVNVPKRPEQQPRKIDVSTESHKG